MENETNNVEISLEEIKDKLSKAGIDFTKWGNGESKTLENLHGELNNGDSKLSELEGVGLIRNVISCGAMVYYSKNGKTFRLKEDRQVFKDGRIRRRNYGHSVSEKAMAWEDPESGMIRGILEELGIEGEITVKKIEENQKLVDSQSYPGLKTKYTLHEYETWLDDSQYNPEGYVEEQSGLSTYFIWEEI